MTLPLDGIRVVEIGHSIAAPYGALVLAEGHIAVRTWADQNYAAFDIFVPGEGLGKLAADHLARVLLPDWTQIKASTRNSFAPPAT